MNVKLIERQPTAVAYLRHLGPYGQPVLQFWMETVYPWLVTNGLLGKPRYGISHDDPSITAPQPCRYHAWAEVPSKFVPSRKALKPTIPGGRDDVKSFQGPVRDVAQDGAA